MSAVTIQSAPSHDGPPTHRSSWGPIRLHLINWFRANASSLAPTYEGAAELLATPTFPGRVHFIAHAVREICNRLSSALDPQIGSDPVPYHEVFKKLDPDWPAMDTLYHDSETPATKITITLSLRTAKLLDGLVRKHRESQQTSKHELLFRILMRNAPTHIALNRHAIDGFKDVFKWFMARTHLPSTASAEVNEEELRQQFEAFEKALYSFVGSFFTGTRELDAILQQANQTTG